MISIEITEVRPTTYNGQVYEHYITGRLPSGQTLDLFDPDMLVQPSSEGEIIDILIGLLVTEDQIQVLTGTENPRIIPAGEAAKRAEEHTYVGRITSVSEDAGGMHDVRMDIGEGTIGFWIGKGNTNWVSEDTLIKVKAIRSDVWELG